MKNKINPFILRPDCTENRMMLKGILADLYPTERYKSNVLLAAFDEGIVGAIQEASVLDSALAIRFHKLLISDYGLSEINAQWAIEYWFQLYGVEVLGKGRTELHQYKKGQPREHGAIVNKKRNDLSTVICLSDLQVGEVLPRGLNHRYKKEEIQHGISELKFIATKTHEYNYRAMLKVSGCYTGKTTQNLLLMIMIFNAEDELIGVDFGENVGDCLSGATTFERNIRVPKDEYISRIDVRFILNPAFVD